MPNAMPRIDSKGREYLFHGTPERLEQFSALDKQHTFIFKLQEFSASFVKHLLLLNGGVLTFNSVILASVEHLNAFTVYFFLACSFSFIASIHYSIRYFIIAMKLQRNIQNFYIEDFNAIFCKKPRTIKDKDEYEGLNGNIEIYGEFAYGCFLLGALLNIGVIITILIPKVT
jgi:hypothetical protein